MSYKKNLGIQFFTGSAEDAVAIGLRGGLVIVPGAPALVELQWNVPYREALLNADLAMFWQSFCEKNAP